MALESLVDFLNLMETTGNHRSDYRKVRCRRIGRVKKVFFYVEFLGFFRNWGLEKSRFFCILSSILKQLFLLPGVDSALFSLVFSFAANNITSSRKTF